MKPTLSESVAALKSKSNDQFSGWATFFGSNEVHPSVIQTMLRHTKPQTTARYILSVNSKQVEAQGKYLKLGKDGKEAA
jgi:hypothetical protein